MTIDFPKESHIPQLRSLWKEAFGDSDAFLDRFFSVGFSPYRCLQVRQHGQTLAALYWFDCRWQDKRIAYIYAVATAQSHRGQGLCRKLMGSTHQILLQLGYSGSIVVPAQTSLQRLYQTLGYEAFGGMDQWTCPAASVPASLQPLSWEEYAAARNVYLPEGSVVQTGALLRFLSGWAAFYQGPDFLVCAVQEQGKLFVPELLGNIQAAGSIVAALGAQQGVFRTPGAQSFAMYHSLEQAAQAPQYFAFALD